MKINPIGKTFLVTGGAGFIGSHVCEELIRRKARVVVVDDLSNGSKNNLKEIINNKNFSFIKADVNDFKALEKVFASVRPDYVIHLAAMVGVNRTSREPLKVFDDMRGIFNVGQLSSKYGIKKILFSSSSEVYGEPLKTPVKEKDIGIVRWPYSIVKHAGEHYFISLAKQAGPAVTVVRFFNVYGPRQDYGESGFVVPIFLSRALAGQPLEVFGKGNQTRDFVFVEDSVRLTLAAFLSDKLDGQPVNIGSGKSVTIQQLSEKIKKILPGTRIITRELRSDGEIIKRQPDVSLMKKALSDYPKTALEEGLFKTAEFIRKNK